MAEPGVIQPRLRGHSGARLAQGDKDWDVPNYSLQRPRHRQEQVIPDNHGGPCLPGLLKVEAHPEGLVIEAEGEQVQPDQVLRIPPLHKPIRLCPFA